MRSLEKLFRNFPAEHIDASAEHIARQSAKASSRDVFRLIIAYTVGLMEAHPDFEFALLSYAHAAQKLELDTFASFISIGAYLEVGARDGEDGSFLFRGGELSKISGEGVRVYLFHAAFIPFSYIYEEQALEVVSGLFGVPIHTLKYMSESIRNRRNGPIRVADMIRLKNGSVQPDYHAHVHADFNFRHSLRAIPNPEQLDALIRGAPVVGHSTHPHMSSAPAAAGPTVHFASSGPSPSRGQPVASYSSDVSMGPMLMNFDDVNHINYMRRLNVVEALKSFMKGADEIKTKVVKAMANIPTPKVRNLDARLALSTITLFETIGDYEHRFCSHFTAVEPLGSMSSAARVSNFHQIDELVDHLYLQPCRTHLAAACKAFVDHLKTRFTTGDEPARFQAVFGPVLTEIANFEAEVAGDAVLGLDKFLTSTQVDCQISGFKYGDGTIMQLMQRISARICWPRMIAVYTAQLADLRPAEGSTVGTWALQLGQARNKYIRFVARIYAIRFGDRALADAAAPFEPWTPAQLLQKFLAYVKDTDARSLGAPFSAWFFPATPHPGLESLPKLFDLLHHIAIGTNDAVYTRPTVAASGFFA